MPSNKVELPLEDGMRIAHEFLLATIRDHYAVIAGSIRRLRPVIHDIDIVFKPHAPPAEELEFRCRLMPRVEVLKWGEKLAAIKYRNVSIDLYFSASAPRGLSENLPVVSDNFETLLLIRTGSVANNIRLATIAKRKGWKLHASGDGLFNEEGKRIAGDSERSIYNALGVSWQEPWERE